jgi:hypothetical protein
MMVNKTKSQSALNLVTGIAELSDNSIEIYPNPANTILYFKNLSGAASYSIYDVRVRKIITGTITNNQVDIGNLENGLYIIHIQDSKNTKIGKLVKK